MVANLIVRNAEETIALALKQRAASYGRSAEAAHREILKQALSGPKRRSLMAGSDQNPVDKQIAAIALINDLIVVTRSGKHFAGTGVQVLEPFAHGVGLG